jgi:hypothetical protein
MNRGVNAESPTRPMPPMTVRRVNFMVASVLHQLCSRSIIVRLRLSVTSFRYTT